MSAPNSEVAICNMALSLVRHKPISSITSPTTDVERLCALFFDQVRKATLRKHTWHFAKKRANLAAGTEPAFGYSAAYPLPNDYIRLIQIGEDTEEIEDYEIENHEILVDTTGALPLIYVFDHQQINRWDPLFITCLYHELAIALGPQLGKSATEIQGLKDLLDDVAPEAYSVNGQERPPRRQESSRARLARRGFTFRRTDIVED